MYTRLCLSNMKLKVKFWILNVNNLVSVEKKRERDAENERDKQTESPKFGHIEDWC